MKHTPRYVVGLAFQMLMVLPIGWCNADVAPRAVGIPTVMCNPCKVQIAQSLAEFSIRFSIKNLPNGDRVVESLLITRDDKPGWAQSLPVKNMDPVGSTDDVFLGTTDINFDGYNDIYFVTSKGTANANAEYWFYVPEKETFSYLGNYPILRIDDVGKRIWTYEGGGHAGLIYEKNYYRFENKKLTLVESEKQDMTNRNGIYVRTKYRYDKGVPRLITKENVKAPAARD